MFSTSSDILHDCPTAPTPSHRLGSRGFALISTLALLLLLAALTLSLQSRAQANLRVIARLTSDLHDHAARDGIFDRLRPLIADAMASPTPDANGLRLNGTPFPMAQSGKDWLVRVQDVEGLVDLYLAPPEILGLLPIEARRAAQTRDELMTQLPPGARFPRLEMTLAQFGIDPGAVAGLVTQSSTSGNLRLSSLPTPLREAATRQTPGPREGEQITRVSITITAGPGNP